MKKARIRQLQVERHEKKRKIERKVCLRFRGTLYVQRKNAIEDRVKRQREKHLSHKK